jgi:DNA polymerase-1
MKKKQFFIVDGNSFIHRAFNALPPLTNSKGFPTGSITGVLNMVNGIIKRFNPEKIVVAFDAKGKNFRHEMYSDYKANRAPMDDDLRVQLQPIKDIISAWGLPTLCIDGVEADDSMTTLAIKAEALGYEVVMATSDKDMRQAVSDTILILDTKEILEKNSKPFGREGVLERSGVYPEKIVDLLALTGDKADNVPGVTGCGDKTAIKWLSAYDDVAGVIKNADSIGGKIGEKLRVDIENGNLELSYELVTIDKNVDLGKEVEEFVGTKDEDLLYKLASEYELNTFKKSLGLKDSSAESIDLTVINDKESLDSYLGGNDWQNSEIFLDCFNHKDKDYILLMNKANSNVYIFEPSEYKEDLLRIVRLSILQDDTYLCGNNVKEVIKLIHSVINDVAAFSVKIKDSRILDYIRNGGKSKIASIEYLNDMYSQLSLSELRPKYKLDDKTPKWTKMSLEETIEVKAEEIFLAKNILLQSYEDLDMKSLELDYKLSPILAMMESNGALIDVDMLNSQGKELDCQIKALEKEIFEIAGEEFNISSAPQVAKILFDVLEIESKKKSTGEEVLIKLSADNPIVKMILDYRSLAKLKSTYIVGLTSRADKENLLHTTYNQTLTKTSRLSSIDPNLQNIPIRSEDGKKIRRSFIAREGYKILALDYSQIELRILAHFAQEPSFIHAFNNGIDIHSLTASEILGIHIDEVTSDQRRCFKAVNFGLIYGMGFKKLAEEIGVTNKEAKAYLDGYFENYDSIKPYFENQLALAKVNLYVETLMGRKIPAKEVNTNNAFARSHVELAAKNAGIQGTAADIIKMAMVDIADWMNHNIKENVFLTMQVHDELVFEVPEHLASELAEKIKYIMENAVKLSVPLVVDYKIADNWLEAH